MADAIATDLAIGGIAVAGALCIAMGTVYGINYMKGETKNEATDFGFDPNLDQPRRRSSSSSRNSRNSRNSDISLIGSEEGKEGKGRRKRTRRTRSR